MVKFNKKKRKTQERRWWRRCGVFFVNFGHILHHALVILLLTLNVHLISLELKQWRFWVRWTMFSRKHCVYLIGVYELQFNFLFKSYKFLGNESICKRSTYKVVMRKLVVGLPWRGLCKALSNIYDKALLKGTYNL